MAGLGLYRKLILLMNELGGRFSAYNANFISSKTSGSQPLLEI